MSSCWGAPLLRVLLLLFLPGVQMCSAVLGELESRHADLALRLWAPGSSHMRTLVGLCAQAFLGVRSGAAGARLRGLRSSAACLSLLACAPLTRNLPASSVPL